MNRTQPKFQNTSWIFLGLMLQTICLFGGGFQSSRYVPNEYDESHVKIGGNYTYLYLTPNRWPTFSGNLGGAQFSYEKRTFDSLYQGLTFLWRQGSVSSSSGSRDIFDIDTQARLGYAARLWENGLAVPFTGFGWRYLSQELGGLFTQHLNYNEVYLPVGLLLEHKFTCKFSVGLNGIWMPQVFPTLNFVPPNNVRWITEWQLSNFQLELPFLYRFGGDWKGLLEVKPFFQYWKNGETVSRIGGSPSNTYYFAGVQLNLGMRI